MVGAAGSVFGVFLILRRLALIADTLSHVALAGIAVGILTRTAPVYVALGTTTLAAAYIEELRTRKFLPGDTVLAVFLYAAIAIATVIIGLANGFDARLFGYLFGSVLTISVSDLWLVGGMAITVAIFSFLLFSELSQIAFDSELAEVNGIKVRLINLGFAILTGVVITVAMRVAGILLVGALVVIPALTAMRIGRSLIQTVLIAAFIGATTALLGIIISFYADIAPAGSVVLTAIAILVLVELLAWLKRALQRRKAGALPTEDQDELIKGYSKEGERAS